MAKSTATAQTITSDNEEINVDALAGLKDSFLATCAEMAVKHPIVCTVASWAYAFAIGYMLGLLLELAAYALALGVLALTGSIVAGQFVYTATIVGGIAYIVWDAIKGGPVTTKINAISAAAGITTVGSIAHGWKKLTGMFSKE